jgi:hypothetical protein
MKVRNLVPWSGPNFYFEPGRELDLPDEVAAARCARGLCEPIEAEPNEAPESPRRGRSQRGQ